MLVQQPLNRVWLTAQMSIAHAAAGQSEEAREASAWVLSQNPLERDALYGADVLENVAHMSVLIGDYETAIDLLERLLQVPSLISANLLELDPTWAPLRSHPRFKELLHQYGN
jgi:tetratricopeptide (TPR) repeat protein